MSYLTEVIVDLKAEDTGGVKIRRLDETKQSNLYVIQAGDGQFIRDRYSKTNKIVNAKFWGDKGEANTYLKDQPKFAKEKDQESIKSWKVVPVKITLGESVRLDESRYDMQGFDKAKSLIAQVIYDDIIATAKEGVEEGDDSFEDTVEGMLNDEALDEFIEQTKDDIFFIIRQKWDDSQK